MNIIESMIARYVCTLQNPTYPKLTDPNLTSLYLT